jgi:hypothetical protein
MRQSAAAETGAITFVKPSSSPINAGDFLSAFIGGYMFLFR